MFGSRKRELVALINSFRQSISDETLNEIIENVEYNEYGLALETLSDTIYELNVVVNLEQLSEILRLSPVFGVDETYHVFIGKTPPYPDLRTKEQREIEEKLSNPTVENIKFLASKGLIIYAVKMHKELFGTDLKEAVEQVNALIGKDK